MEWNNTSTKYPDDKCIHQLFEAQVERSPDAIAVVFEDQQFTYRELNCHANQLAHHLQVLGRPEFVGLYVERGLEMVVGLLAIRLANLIEQSGATVMQATPTTWGLLLAAEWQGNSQLKILCGGEALPRELANQLLVRSQSLWNMYGPN